MKKSMNTIIVPILLVIAAVGLVVFQTKKASDLEIRVRNLEAIIETYSNELAVHGSVISKLQAAFAPATTLPPVPEKVTESSVS